MGGARAREPRPIDLTGLVVLVASGILFASQLYEAGHVEQFTYRVGIATPAGHRLKVSGRHFSPLFETYVGTSRATVWVEREFVRASLDEEAERLEAARDVLSELVYYFGMTLQNGTFDAQIEHIRGYGGIPV